MADTPGSRVFIYAVMGVRSSLGLRTAWRLRYWQGLKLRHGGLFRKPAHEVIERFRGLLLPLARPRGHHEGGHVILSHDDHVGNHVHLDAAILRPQLGG